jgi:penicillin-binding protein 1A
MQTLLHPWLHRFMQANFTMAGATFGLIGGLTVTLASHAPSERDLPIILTSPQIEVDARYLRPEARSEFAQHAVCHCGLWLGGDQIPDMLKRALLAKEDARFYVHRGIDWIGLGRALVSMASGGSTQGGSTLTQQLVKNLITGNARAGLPGVLRKMREVIIARRVEHVLTKEQILAAYFNQMDFGSAEGSTAIGIVHAARKYFGKSVKDLNVYEDAMLVGMLRATTTYNPISHHDAADQQARIVLQKMLDQNLIRQADFSRALRQTRQHGSRPQIAISTGYYIAWARPELAQIERAHPTRGRVRYVVGLDTWYQVHGEAAIKEAIAQSEDRHVGQGALVSLASDGRVTALVGGTDFAASQFDRATQAMRQPGSAFKLFVYLAAFKKGLTPNSIRLDEPFSVDGWTPDNADRQFLGPITLREAFARSRNTVAARVASEVGIDAVVKQARELGIRSPLGHDPSLALGTSEVTLLELTSAYTPFMNEGHAVQPYAARIALDSSGQVIYRRPQMREAAVVNDKIRRNMRDMLRAVVTDGTGWNAKLRDVWSGGKSGTSQGNRDAWFVGLTDRLTTGVWFGNDDNGEMTNVAGANLPAIAWRRFNEATHGLPASDPGAPPRPPIKAAIKASADPKLPERTPQTAAPGIGIFPDRHCAQRDRLGLFRALNGRSADAAPPRRTSPRHNSRPRAYGELRSC